MSTHDDIQSWVILAKDTLPDIKNILSTLAEVTETGLSRIVAGIVKQHSHLLGVLPSCELRPPNLVGILDINIEVGVELILEELCKLLDVVI